MSTRPKKKDKKLDPARAAIYVAAIALIGTISAAFIANMDKIFPKKQNSEADAISLFQGEKHDEVLRTLDQRTDLLQQIRDSSTKAEASNSEQKGQLARKRTLSKAYTTEQEKPAPYYPTHLTNDQIAAIDAYLKHNKDTRRAIEANHLEFISAVQKGDNLRATVLKTEINRILAEDSWKYNEVENMIGLRNQLGPRVYYERQMIIPTPTP